jgi:hypothetical protein
MEFVTEHIEQWSLRVDINCVDSTIDLQRNEGHVLLRLASAKGRTEHSDSPVNVEASTPGQHTSTITNLLMGLLQWIICCCGYAPKL